MSQGIYLPFKGLNRYYNVSIDSPASSGGQGKYKKYLSVPWPLGRVAQSV